MSRIRGDLPERTLEFALLVLSITDELPRNNKGWVIGKQLLRSGTSIGANVREADEALTDAEFRHRCSLARREASESHYWLLLCKRGLDVQGHMIDRAINEALQLTRVLATIVRLLHTDR